MRLPFTAIAGYLIVVLTLEGCQECEDCTTALTEPLVNFLFINADSLASIESTTTANVVEADAIGIVRDSLVTNSDVLQDSLEALQVGIDTGNTDLIPKRDEVQEVLERDALTIANQEQLIDSLATVNSELLAVKAVINSGSLLVEQVTNLNSGRSITFTDSLQGHRLPMEINQTETNYEILIDGSAYEVTLNHTNSETLTVRRAINIAIQDIALAGHTFDSAFVHCATSNCRPDATTVTCYF